MLYMRNSFMSSALEEARKAFDKNEVPVGAVVVFHGNIVSRAHNETIEQDNLLAHAEFLAISRAVTSLKESRLFDCDVYITLEPCCMCLGAISLVNIRRVYFGAYRNSESNPQNAEYTRVIKENYLDYVPEIYGGIMQEECENIMKNFFKELR